MEKNRSNSNKTVLFDVGGKIYRVARSLLKQHSDTMLARIASDTWCSIDHKEEVGKNNNRNNGNNNNNDNTNDNKLFIERNGDRFQYVLDFMRDGGYVSLPTNIPKDALLQDLAYFGFQDIDPAKITVTVSASLFSDCHDHFELYLEKIKVTRKLLDLVVYCLSEYKTHGKLRVIVKYDYKKDLYCTACNMINSQQLRQEFGSHLEEIGLKIKSVEYNSSNENNMAIILLDFL